MSRSSSFVALWAVRFRRFLVRRGFSQFALKQYLIVVRDFLRHLEALGVDPTAAQSSHIRSFLKRELVRYRHRHRREPRNLVDWRSHAPYSPFSRGSCLSSIVHRRLRATGLPFSGRHGAHAFRYARAVSLLRASVPLKSISDLLGHSLAASTEVYLKLATDDLREVGLELPALLSHDPEAGLERLRRPPRFGSRFGRSFVITSTACARSDTSARKAGSCGSTDSSSAPRVPSHCRS